MRVGLGEHQHRTRIAEHELHLLGRTGLVDRNGQRADGHDREVDDRPFVAGCRQQRHAVAGLDTFGDQAQCRRTDLACRLGRRHIPPLAVDEALEDHVVGVVALVRVDGAGDVVAHADFERCRNTELAHGGALRGGSGFAFGSA
jgi:hypothetical protein